MINPVELLLFEEEEEYKTVDWNKNKHPGVNVRTQ